MGNLTITITAPPIPTMGTKEAILEAFEEKAGKKIIEGIQLVLGTESIYRLSDEYSKRKPSLKRFKRVAGKADDQPLILSANMYENFEATRQGNILTVGEKDGEGVSGKGFDYADFWEGRTEYLEKGLESIGGEEALADILEACIVEALG